MKYLWKIRTSGNRNSRDRTSGGPPVNVFTIQIMNMYPNCNHCLDIKGLRFFTKEVCPYYCRFLHTQKDSGGASIHRIDKLFPLKPYLTSGQKL